MKLKLSILFLFCLGSLAYAAEQENTLEVWAREYQRRGVPASEKITLSATLKVHRHTHYLAFRLTNVSKEILHTYRSLLPWGIPNMVNLAAFTTDGQRLQNEYPVADPSFADPIDIAPGQTLRGECPISWNVIGVDERRKQDVMVLWFYDMFLRAVSESTPAQHTAIYSGVVVIPKSK